MDNVRCINRRESDMPRVLDIHSTATDNENYDNDNYDNYDNDDCRSLFLYMPLCMARCRTIPAGWPLRSRVRARLASSHALHSAKYDLLKAGAAGISNYDHYDHNNHHDHHHYHNHYHNNYHNHNVYH